MTKYLEKRLDRIEQQQGYQQPLVLICHSFENESEQIEQCLQQHGKEPDHVIRLLATHKNHDNGELFYTYGGVPYDG